MLWLAIVGIVFAVIGAFYYLRVIKVMYFDEPVGEAHAARATTARCASCFGVNALALLVLGIFWNPLMALVPGTRSRLNAERECRRLRGLAIIRASHHNSRS